MSEKGITKIKAVANNEAARTQLKEFTEKCQSTSEPFSLEPLYPMPEEMKRYSSEAMHKGLAIIKHRNGDDSRLINILNRSEYWGKGIHSITALEDYLINSQEADLKLGQEVYDDSSKDMTGKAQEWCYENWGVKYDAYNSKILIDKEDVFEVEFGITNGNADNWLIEVSKDFPDLYFYNKYYLSPWEGLEEGQNGKFVDHSATNPDPAKITSKNFADYKEYSLLAPRDNKGKDYPFTFTVVNSSSVIVNIKDKITDSQCAKIIDKRFYEKQILASIVNYCKIKNIDIPINFNSENDAPILEYSVLINASTIEEAIEASLNIIDDIHKPFDEAIKKIKELLIKEFGMDAEAFESKYPKQNPLFN